MRRWLSWLLFAAGLVITVQCRAADEPLVVVPGTSHVDITTDFAGADVKAFGAMSGSGDLIIKVVGPQQEVTLSREKKFGPFWIGGGRVNVEEAPSLLYLYATRPIASILPPEAQEKYGLRLEGVPVRIEPQLLAAAANDWRKTFFRLKEKEGRYLEDDRAIKVYGNRLFITDIPLPSDLQLGTYQIETLLVQSGKVAGHDIGHFEVRQVGIERWVWNVAHDHAWLFGAIFTLAVMLLGLALNAIFHRRHQ
jgi:uncharacterized protein (TIGR02186 family)